MSSTRFLCWLMILLLPFFMAACNLLDKTAEEYLAASQNYYDKSEYSSSLIEIKNAIQQNPASSEIRQFAAKVYLKLGKGNEAAIQLTKALSLGANQGELMPLQAHAWFKQRQYKQVQALQIPAGLSKDEQSNILVYQGFASAELKENNLAAEFYQQSLIFKPDNRLAQRGVALLFASQGKYDEALKMIRELIKKQPQDSELLGLQGDISVSAKQYDNAYASYTKAIEHEKGSQYPYLAKRVLVCLSMDDIDCSVRDLTELENNVPDYYMTEYSKGLLAVKQKRWKDAQTALSSALSNNSELAPAYYFSGLSHYQQQQYGPAVTQLSAFVARQPDSVNGRHLLSRAQLKEGHLESAKTTLQPIINGGKIDSSVMFLLGQIEYSLGNIPESIHYFKLLSDRHPESAHAHTQLGLKLMASGDKPGAQDELAIAIDIAPDLLEAGQASVLAYLDSKEFAKAQALIDKMQVNSENNASLLNLQGVLYMQKREYKQAAQFFKQALVHSPGDPTASHNLTRLLLQQGKYQDVSQIYNNVIDLHPHHVPTHLKLAELDLSRGNDIKAEQRLLDLMAQLPEALGPRLMLAKYYLISGRVDSVKNVLEPVEKLYPTDQRLLTLSIESLLAGGRFGQAKHEAQILVSQLPDSVDAHWLLARAAIADRDAIKADQALKQTLLLAPEHIPAQVVQIKLFSESKQFDKATDALNRLMSHSAGDPRVGSVAAWMAFEKGDYNKAVSLYAKVFSTTTSSANALGLSQALWHTGQHEKAITTLQDWTLKNPDDMKAQFRLALIYQQTGLEGEASARFSRVLQFEPDNVIALNNLAWLMRNENSTRALEYIERATQLAPENGPVFDTLGVVLLLQGKISRALRVLERAANSHQENPAIHYHLAIALHRNNKTSEAIGVLETLLVSFAEFNDRPEAQMLLRKLKTFSAVSS